MVTGLRDNIREINRFILKPTEDCLGQTSLEDKLTLFATALLYHICIGGFLGLGIIYLIDRFLFNIQHAVELSAHTALVAIILAPIAEEALFRLPLTYHHNYLVRPIKVLLKVDLQPYWRRYFPTIVYVFVSLFALLHVSNYQNSSILFYVFSVFVVLPQLVGGLTLSFTRIRLGFWWGVLQHALYNLIFVLLAMV